MKRINWQFCKDPNDINTAIAEQDEDWYGLKNAEQIVSIYYDTNHNCYVVFWVYESEAVETSSGKEKHGEWEEVKRWECTTHSVTDMKCSVCHHYAEQVLPHQTTCTWDFCPNCGADMREWKKTNFLRKQKEKKMRGETE